MNRPKVLTRFAVASLLVAAFAVAAAAQTATIGGKVYLKQADGSKAPLPGAIVKIYRTDIKQEFDTKSDKSGQYVRAGLPFIGTYTFVFSGPGASPWYFSNVKAGAIPPDKLTSFDVTLEAGDGSTLTLDQVKAMEAAGGASPAANAASAANSAEAKKRAAELDAERKKIEAENAKATEINVKLPEIMKAGNEAFAAAEKLTDSTARLAKYDEAIARYDEGLALDARQPNILRNKAIVLLQRGRDKYNVALKAKDQAGKEAGRADFKASAEAAEQALSLNRELKKSAAPAAAATPGQNEELPFLSTRFDAYRVSLQTSAPIDNDAAAKAIEEYINAEPDQAKKDKAQSSLGDALFFAGRVDDSIAKFREVLAKNPNNLEAMYGLGISLAAKVADATKDAALLNEAHDMLQQFVAKAPEGYPRKQEAAESVKYLEETLAANKSVDTKSNKGNVRRKP
jgi:tetratricopeptide (TPR) repeat protein